MVIYVKQIHMYKKIYIYILSRIITRQFKCHYMVIRVSKDPQYPYGSHTLLLVIYQYIFMNTVDSCLHVLPCSGT